MLTSKRWALVAATLIAIPLLGWGWIALRPEAPVTEGSVGELEPSEPFHLCVGRRTEHCVSVSAAEAVLRGHFDLDLAVPPPGGTQGSAVFQASAGGKRYALKWRPGASQSLLSDPAKELGGYALQALLLEPKDYVIPPTEVVCLAPQDLGQVTGLPVAPTEGLPCALGYVSWWVSGAVGHDDAVEAGLAPADDMTLMDPARFAESAAYRRNIAALNLVTYLTRNVDAHLGQFVVYPDDGHWFAVDGSMAFDVVANPRVAVQANLGRMVVPSIPADFVERLRAIDRAALDSLLVLAEWTRDGDTLERRPNGPPFNTDERLREAGSRIQLGLGPSEIQGVWERLQALLDSVDAGDIDIER